MTGVGVDRRDRAGLEKRAENCYVRHRTLSHSGVPDEGSYLAAGIHSANRDAREPQ